MNLLSLTRTAQLVRVSNTGKDYDGRLFKAAEYQRRQGKGSCSPGWATEQPEKLSGLGNKACSVQSVHGQNGLLGEGFLTVYLSLDFTMSLHIQFLSTMRTVTEQ